VASADEVREREEERTRYLVAFYDLTLDEPLRWATHRQIAEAARIPEERVLTLSQQLHQAGFVKLRTMGGIDGSVELTPLGVLHAEQAIKQGDGSGRSTPPPGQSDSDWAQVNAPMVELAFDAFLQHLEWPDIAQLQRALDRAGQTIDVAEALSTLPRLPQEAAPAYPTRFYVPLRMLRHLPEAQPLLDACFELVKRAIDLYFSDSETMEISSDDAWTSLAYSREDLALAARLLLQDFPNPFAGGGYGPDGSWRLTVNGALARRFRGIASIDEYFQRQREIRNQDLQQFASVAQRLRELPEGTSGDASAAESAATDGAAPAAPRPTIFVMMPFGETWSQGVYDFIRRAIRTLGCNAQVVRSDEISRPGKIDQQIIQTIALADVVVADITGVNPNVMWELGYAQALLIPAVLMNQHVDASPFDLVSTRQVAYRLAPTDDDEQKLADHIKSALDDRQTARSSAH
jgi:hypothetical protein